MICETLIFPQKSAILCKSFSAYGTYSSFCLLGAWQNPDTGWSVGCRSSCSGARSTTGSVGGRDLCTPKRSAPYNRIPAELRTRRVDISSMPVISSSSLSKGADRVSQDPVLQRFIRRKRSFLPPPQWSKAPFCYRGCATAPLCCNLKTPR